MIGQDNGFGVSFLPNGDQRYARPDEQGGGGQGPLQEAIKILSMRIPRVVGANPLAPLALLTSPGSGGLQAGQLEQLMRTLGLGPSVEATGMPGGEGPMVGGAPSPFAANVGFRPGAGGGTLMGRPPAGRGAPPNIAIGTGGPGGMLPMPDQPAPGPAVAPPAAPPQDDSAALWELAQRQREGLGRVMY